MCNAVSLVELHGKESGFKKGYQLLGVEVLLFGDALHDFLVEIGNLRFEEEIQLLLFVCDLLLVKPWQSQEGIFDLNGFLKILNAVLHLGATREVEGHALHVDLLLRQVHECLVGIAHVAVLGELVVFWGDRFHEFFQNSQFVRLAELSTVLTTFAFALETTASAAGFAANF